MVYYIRFLKTPKVENGKLRALVTITTDLGDSFYPGNVTIHALVAETYPQDISSWESEWHQTQWKSGTRNAWIEIKGIPYGKWRRYQLILSSKETKSGNITFLNDLPEVMGARCVNNGKLVERRYRTESGHERLLYEESGESIARHIWDAGVALVAYLCNVVNQDNPDKQTALLAKILSAAHGPRVLELGTGCGIVGLEMHYLCPNSEVILTDLPEAMEVLDHNAQLVRSRTDEGHLETMVLDWEEPLPEPLKKAPKDVILVSDCTYNSDSIPALVKTLAALIGISPSALAVVSMKVRHDSEATFFDLMSNAGLVSLEHSTIPMPDRFRSESGQRLEVIDVYVYAKKHDH